MANSIINADSEGLKQTGGDSNILDIRTGGNNAISISATGTVTLPAAALPVGSGGTGANTLTANNVILGNGTSAVTFVAPGTASNVLTSNGSAWVSQAAAAGGGDYIMQVFTTPGTWTKAAGLKAIKVTVIGGGGGLASGGTSSFGSPAFLSATGGGGGPAGYVGGAGSGGQINATGSAGAGGIPYVCSAVYVVMSGASAFGFGGALNKVGPGTPQAAGKIYGGGSDLGTAGAGGAGGAIEYIDAPALPGPQPYTVGAGGPGPGGANGGAGIIVVEEFY
jgi:hypothetical protein